MEKREIIVVPGGGLSLSHPRWPSIYERQPCSRGSHAGLAFHMPPSARLPGQIPNSYTRPAARLNTAQAPRAIHALDRGRLWKRYLVGPVFAQWSTWLLFQPDRPPSLLPQYSWQHDRQSASRCGAFREVAVARVSRSSALSAGCFLRGYKHRHSHGDSRRWLAIPLLQQLRFQPRIAAISSGHNTRKRRIISLEC